MRVHPCISNPYSMHAIIITQCHACAWVETSAKVLNRENHEPAIGTELWLAVEMAYSLEYVTGVCLSC